MSDKEKREQEEKEKEQLKRDQPDLSHEEDSNDDYSDVGPTEEDQQK